MDNATVLDESIETSDGINLACQYQEVKDSFAVAVIIHGFGEHQGLYTEMCSNLAKKAILPFSFDLRGHGSSGGKRQDFGTMENLLDDLELVIARVESKFPDLPIALFGNNIGAIVAGLYCQFNKRKIVALNLHGIPWHWQSTSTQRTIQPILKVIGPVSSSFRQAIAGSEKHMRHSKPLGLLQLMDIEKSRIALKRNAFHLLTPLLLTGAGPGREEDEEMLSEVCSYHKNAIVTGPSMYSKSVYPILVDWLCEFRDSGQLEDVHEMYEELNVNDGTLFV